MLSLSAVAEAYCVAQGLEPDAYTLSELPDGIQTVYRSHGIPPGKNTYPVKRYNLPGVGVSAVQINPALPGQRGELLISGVSLDLEDKEPPPYFKRPVDTFLSSVYNTYPYRFSGYSDEDGVLLRYYVKKLPYTVRVTYEAIASGPIEAARHFTWIYDRVVTESKDFYCMVYGSGKVETLARFQAPVVETPLDLPRYCFRSGFGDRIELLRKVYDYLAGNVSTLAKGLELIDLRPIRE